MKDLSEPYVYLKSFLDWANKSNTNRRPFIEDSLNNMKQPNNWTKNFEAYLFHFCTYELVLQKKDSFGEKAESQYFLLQALNHIRPCNTWPNPVGYLRPCQSTTVELFWKISWQVIRACWQVDKSLELVELVVNWSLFYNHANKGIDNYLCTFASIF